MAEYEVGQIVDYLGPDEQWNRGKVHGIQTAEKDGELVFTGFLIDTGGSVREDKISVGDKFVIERQPEQVWVTADQIRPL